MYTLLRLIHPILRDHFHWHLCLKKEVLRLKNKFFFHVAPLFSITTIRVMTTRLMRSILLYINTWPP